MQIPFIGTAVLLLLYNVFFYHTGFGLGWLAFLIPVFAYLLLTHKKNGNMAISVASSILALTLYTLWSITGNWFTKNISMFVAVFLTVCTVFTSKLEKPFSFTFLHTIFSPLLVLLYGCGSILSQFNHKPGGPKKHTYVFSHIRGLLLALPAFVILLALFQSADPLYNKFVHMLFDNIWGRIVATGFFGALFLFVGLISLSSPPTFPEGDRKEKEGVYEELRTFLSLIAFIIGTFVVIQIKYLFLRVSEGELSSVLGISGYTYSQYVTKGFFELIVASALSGIVLLFAAHRFPRVVAPKKQPIRILAFGIGIEVAILIASAFQRLQLYVGSHGLTLARGYGVLLLVSITIVIALCLLHYVTVLGKKSRFILWCIPGFIFLFGLHVVSLDQLVATRFPPTVNGTIDYYYISRLSPDAYPSWNQAIVEVERISEELGKKQEWSQENRTVLFWNGKTIEGFCKNMTSVTLLFGSVDEIRDIRSACLPYEPYYLWKFNETGKFSDLPQRFSQSRGWQSFQLSSYRAYQYLWSHKEIIERIKTSNTRMSDITEHFSPSWETSISHDRAINPMFLE